MGEVTYEQLFDIVRRERSREEIQPLEPGFYVSVQAYLRSQESTLRGMDLLSSDAERLRIQLQNSMKLLRELYDRREKKILHLALNKARTGSHIIDTSALLARERDIYQQAVAMLSTARQETLLNDKPAVAQSPAPSPTPTRSAAPEPTPKPVESTTSGVLLKILSAVPKFMGSPTETYGPFDEGAQVSLPQRIAEVLVRKGRAERV